MSVEVVTVESETTVSGRVPSTPLAANTLLTDTNTIEAKANTNNFFIILSVFIVIKYVVLLTLIFMQRACQKGDERANCLILRKKKIFMRIGEVWKLWNNCGIIPQFRSPILWKTPPLPPRYFGGLGKSTCFARENKLFCLGKQLVLIRKITCFIVSSTNSTLCAQPCYCQTVETHSCVSASCQVFATGDFIRQSCLPRRKNASLQVFVELTTEHLPSAL